MCTEREFMVKIAVLWVFVACIHEVWCQDFGYDGTVGPNYWGEKFQQCIGKHQSPINIEEHNVELVKLYPMHFENFDLDPELAEIQNNGHTVIVTLNTTHKPRVSGGPLLGKYEFAQLHFHWGSDDSEGSENKINNSSFPMELHMVFYQRAYGSVSHAMEHPDGLAVLSFLYSNSPTENANYKPLISVVSSLESNSAQYITNFPAFDKLLVANRSMYYTYGGSLTTPPCSEVVTWIEFKKTIPLANSQIERFRQLKDAHGNSLTHNFRPTQPLHGRLIRMVRDEEDLIKKEHLKRNSAASFTANTYFGVIFIALTTYLCTR